MNKVELAVIGAGPAGLAAAIEAAQLGVKVVVFDENAQPGGQLFKQIHKFFGSREHKAGTRGFRIGQELLAQTEQLGVKVNLGSTVFGLDKRNLWVLKDGRTEVFQTDAVIVATGASENALAFKGSTLPGVMTAGAAQTFINLHRVLPGKKVLMVGSGNVGLIVSYQLMQAGAEVVGLVEAAPQIGGYGVHAAKIKRAGVPLFLGHTITEAIGEHQVESAVLTKLNGRFQPIPGSEKTLEADTICIAVGLTPMMELARMAGAEFKYAPQMGGHVPIINDNMETSIAGMFVAGDVCGVEEASSAMEEGRLAGVTAAEYLEYVDGIAAADRKALIREQLSAIRNGTFGIKAHPRDEVKEENIYGLKSSGTPSKDELDSCPGVPSKERLAKGPVAVIECVQEIPCNPCEQACPRGAIKVGKPITSLPQLTENVCNGCASCVTACPGLAIVTVDRTYDENKALVTFPYEYLPLPETGAIVDAVNRQGEKICSGQVVKVRNNKKADGTVAISLAVPEEYAMEVRSMAKGGTK